MRLKRTAYDKWFSDAIRVANNWTCESCLKEYGGRSMGLHLSHYIGRSANSTRHFVMNGFSHCYTCHNHYGSMGSSFYRFFVRKYSEIEEEALDRLKSKPFKLCKYKKDIASHYKQEFERIQELRIQGMMGFIPVQPYDGQPLEWYNEIIQELKNEYREDDRVFVYEKVKEESRGCQHLQE